MGNLLAVAGFCALFGAAGAGANAQRSDDHKMDRMGDHGMSDHDRMGGGGFRSHLSEASTRRLRREILSLKAVYDHEIRSGHTAAALRAHRRANAIREQLHERRHDRGF
jgi:L-serine deaminase